MDINQPNRKPFSILTCSADNWKSLTASVSFCSIPWPCENKKNTTEKQQKLLKNFYLVRMFNYDRPKNSVRFKESDQCLETIHNNLPTLCADFNKNLITTFHFSWNHQITSFAERFAFEKNDWFEASIWIILSYRFVESIKTPLEWIIKVYSRNKPGWPRSAINYT